MQDDTIRYRLALGAVKALLGTEAAVQLAIVTARVDDAAGSEQTGSGLGWLAYGGGPNDRDPSEMQQQYANALEAWRKNPFAKRMVDLVTDYTLGDGMRPEAPGQIGAFVRRWWDHPKNRLDLRLPELSDELARAGDLFLTLHRNPADGLSYIRPVPKDRILHIETLDNDWETEIAYEELLEVGCTRRWISPDHPDSAGANGVMVHYAVNRVVGALCGESDLATVIPWLLKYSRLVEDRVRLHWAARAFLWIVTVPANKVQAKREQYRAAPRSGSIIVKDEAEDWQPVAPNLHGLDARFDLRAVRQMIDAGSGMPPHWRGEAHDVSLATAEAMEHAASRHLRRRQLYLRHMVQDLAHTAYQRAYQIGRVRARPNRQAIRVDVVDLDRGDNRELAAAARDVARALATVRTELAAAPSPAFRRLLLRLVLRFAGEEAGEELVDGVLAELPAPAGVTPGEVPGD